MNDELANDRTYLAWLRTAIALYGLGFVVSKSAFFIDPNEKGFDDQALYTAVGVLIVLMGAATLVVGFRQHRAFFRAIVANGYDARRALWPGVITTFSVVGALLLSVLIVVST
jgi:putative membrane protein